LVIILHLLFENAALLSPDPPETSSTASLPTKNYNLDLIKSKKNPLKRVTGENEDSENEKKVI